MFSDDPEAQPASIPFTFSRKEQRLAFQELNKRAAEQKLDLCEVTQNALKGTIELLKKLDANRDSKAVRTELMRGISYVHIARFVCGRNGGSKGEK